ncbi:hypothetical protein HY407_04765, partial [Candidatus Gottesmanbacteria bacterium]|nr:hypothetical protein [Candidatus Gottesmanbacteria bacterium]
IIYLIYARAEIRTNWKRIISHILVALSLGQIINNLQRLSSVYYLFEAKNQQFQQPLEKLLKEPFTLTWGNLNGFFSWIIPYYTWPIFIVGLFAFVVLIWQKRKQGLILLLLWFTPIFILATVGREIFPRYILFTTPYFLISVAYLIILITDPALAGTDRAKRGLIKLILTLIILLPSLHFDYLLLTNPPKAPLPKTDYHQYISEHPSGYGLDKIFTFLDDELKKEPVTLVTQGTFGLYHYAFLLEYWDNPNITIVPRWPLSVLDQEIFDRAKSQKTYILLKEHEEIPPQLPLKLVLKAEKPGGKYPLLLTTLK